MGSERLFDNLAPGIPVLVLIDESGDPGFKTDRGSSPVFVLAMVVFSDFAEAERVGKIIGEARTALRVKTEFKFTKSHANVRSGFFEAVCGCNFRVRALVVDKRKIYSPHLRANAGDFYRYFVQMLLRHDGGALTGAHVKIDGSGDEEFKREINTYLRRSLRDGQIAKFRFQDSRTDNLVQLADMCAGAIARGYRWDEKQDRQWVTQIRRAGRVDNIWSFGEF